MVRAARQLLISRRWLRISTALLAALSAAALASPFAALAAGPPSAETTAVHGYVSATGARLLGALNPNGSQITACHFEYGPTEGYGQSAPCEKYPEAKEAGESPYTVGAQVEGLAPETTYHYRLVSKIEAGGPVAGIDRTITTEPAQPPAAPCPNEQIRQRQGSTALPECLAYELVTPPDAIADFDGAALWPDGSVTYSAQVPNAPDQATGNIDSVLASRTPTGWRRFDLAPGGDDRGYAINSLSPDASQALVTSCAKFAALGCSAGSAPKYRLRFERVSNTGGERILAVPELPHLFNDAPLPVLGGTSVDQETVYLNNPEGAAPLLPDDSHLHGNGLYIARGGELAFAGYDENGAVLPCGAVLANGIHAELSGSNAGFEQSGVSADGDTIAFESPDPNAVIRGACPGPTDLYMRHEGETVKVSAPRPGDPDLGATFAGMTRNGATVFFLTPSKLLSSDVDETSDLYSYELQSDTYTLLSGDVPGAITTNRIGGPPYAQTAVSPAGDPIYFLSEVEGSTALYAYHAGHSARLAVSPAGDTHLGPSFLSSYEAPQVTPDGEHLVFVSNAPLTGQRLNRHLQEFQYSAQDQTLTCSSCPPDGAAPTANARPELQQSAQNLRADWRVQSDDGATVVFNTDAPLLPEDEDDTEDPYLWRQGSLSLLTPGPESRHSRAWGIDANGENVLISASGDLSADAAGDLPKLFVLRIGGGYLQPPQPTPCEGSLCRNPGTFAGSAESPGSAFFNASPTRKPHRHRHHRHRHRRPRHSAAHRPPQPARRPHGVQP
jgi:hypothetical protein